MDHFKNTILQNFDPKRFDYTAKTGSERCFKNVFPEDVQSLSFCVPLFR